MKVVARALLDLVEQRGATSWTHVRPAASACSARRLTPGLEPIDELAVLEGFECTDAMVEVPPASLEQFRAVLSATMTG